MTRLNAASLGTYRGIKSMYFLRPEVRYWVCSSHVPLWQGQEEDIIAEIVQEAVIHTFEYSLEYSSWQEGVSCASLKHISKFIAYKQYRD